MIKFNRGAFNRRTITIKFFRGTNSLRSYSKSENFNTISHFKGNGILEVRNKTDILTMISNFSGKSNLGIHNKSVLNIKSIFSGRAKKKVLSKGYMVRARHPAEVFYFEPNAKFNRMSFNRGRFTNKEHKRINTTLKINSTGSMVSVVTFDGISQLNVFTKTTKLNTVSAFVGSGKIHLLSMGYITAIRGLEGKSKQELQAQGYVNAVRSFKGTAFFVLRNNSDEFFTFRLEYIDLTNLVLRVGEELIINADEKTIMLNGQNVMRYLHRNSEFFNFNPNENEVVFLTTTNNANAQIRILWKDAWI